MHHVQKYTRAILPHASLSFITKLHCNKNKNQVWLGIGSSATKRLFLRLSTALATATSQHVLSIILNTSFPPIHAILSPYYSLSSPISSFPSLHTHNSSQSAQYPPPLHFLNTPYLLFSNHATSYGTLIYNSTHRPSLAVRVKALP